MTNSKKPLASLSLDLDNQWSYMKTHGDEGWDSFPSYLDLLVPRVLETLDKHALQITFFIVGQDAASFQTCLRQHCFKIKVPEVRLVPRDEPATIGCDN